MVVAVGTWMEEGKEVKLFPSILLTFGHSDKKVGEKKKNRGHAPGENPGERYRWDLIRLCRTLRTIEYSEKVKEGK